LRNWGTSWKQRRNTDAHHSKSANIDLAGGRMLSDLHRELAVRGAELKFPEVHGEVRDMLQAEGLQEYVEGIEQRVAVAELVAH